MDMLWKTSPHYVKCIKPNNIKFPGGFSCELVRDQLMYSGVLEVVRIRQQGYPVRRYEKASVFASVVLIMNQDVRGLLQELQIFNTKGARTINQECL